MITVALRVERTASPALFRLAIKRGDGTWTKPEIVTAIQLMANFAALVADMLATPK